MWENNFHTEYDIDYQGLNIHLVTTLPKLVGYLQETSIRHSEAVGLTMQYFFEQMTGWVILSWNIEVLRAPVWLEKVKIYTVPAKFKGMFAQRGFIMKDESGNIILKADSQWVYTSRVTRKPTKLPEQMALKYGTTEPLPIDKGFKLPELEGYEPIYTQSYTITRRDIDTNLHVNNISYIDWAMNSIPEDIYNNLTISHSTINYRKECNLGQSVIIKTYQKDTSFITNIYSNEESLLCEIYTSFNKDGDTYDK